MVDEKVGRGETTKSMRGWMKWWMGAALMAAMSGVGCASTIPAGTYNLTGLSVDGFQLTGTVTLNGSGIVDAAAIQLQDAALGNPVFTNISSTGGPAGYAPVADYAFLGDPGMGQLEIEYLTGLDGAGNVDVCTSSAEDCNSYQASYMQIYEASSFGYGLTPLSGTGELEAAVQNPAPPTAPESSDGSSAATPEPTTLALLGTGILGMAAMTHKRKRRF
jgi:hypothetical protein